LIVFQCKCYLGIDCAARVADATSQGVVVITQVGGGGAGENCNYDMYNSLPLAITVGASTVRQQAATYTETCESVV
jgi:hypothetical protein